MPDSNPAGTNHPKSRADLLKEVINFRFDRQIAEKICIDLSFIRMLGILRDFGHRLTLVEFLECFRSNFSLHEFTARYLEECEASVASNAQ